VVKDTWVAGLQSMSAQLSAAFLHRAGMQGTLMDSANAITVQGAMQTLEAEAYRDYTPGETLCRFGTLTRSLAMVDLKGRANAAALDSALLARETHNEHHGQNFIDRDGVAKFRNAVRLYCNPGDNDGANPLCACTAASCPNPSMRATRDLDFARLFLTSGTLNVDFTDGSITPDEEDVLSFLTNISSYQTLPSLAPGQADIMKNAVLALDFTRMRGITARRSLVRQTWSDYVAHKTPGQEGSTIFMVNAARELGLSKEDAEKFLNAQHQPLALDGKDSGSPNPSYDAQMDILTKRLYQNPNFYTNLIDKPTNVLRTQAAMAAIGLMQRRDLYETALRRELLLSQLLDVSLRDAEDLVRKRTAATGS
jgi:hypothetical protein